MAATVFIRDDSGAAKIDGIKVTETYAGSGTSLSYRLTVSNGTGSGAYAEGAAVSIAAEDRSPGEVFSHWTVDPVAYAANLGDANAASTSFTMPGEAVTLTAHYTTLPTYTITTIAGANGSITPENPSVLQGQDQSFTITPATGYYIESLTVDGVPAAVASTYTIENVQSAQTIAASFAPNTYTVNFELNGGTRSGGGAQMQTIPHGGTAVQPLVLAPPGYDFARWDQALGPITSTRTITAIYTQRSSEWHTVFFNVGARGTRVGGGELVQQVRHGEPAVAPALEVDTGWTFIGWSAAFTAVLDNLQLEAIYTRDPAYAQLTVVSDYGVPSLSGASMIPVDDSVTVTMPEMSLESATARHTCTGWQASDGSSGTGSIANLTLNEDVTLTWLWESEYALEVVTEGPGTVDAAPGFYPGGTKVNLTATPDGDNEFQGWSGAASGMERTISLTMDEPKSVTARFGAHLVEASIDTLSPLRAVLDAPITFSGSAAASGGASIEQYSWRMVELVDGIETGAFVDLSDQATFISSNLPAGQWRVYFNALDSTGAEADAVIGELRIENPALLTDLALMRTDLRFFAQDGSELDPMMANQVRFGDTVRVEITVRNLGGVAVETPVEVSLYDGRGPASLTAYADVEGLLGSATITSLPVGGVAMASIHWSVGYDASGNLLPGYDGSFRLLTAVAEHAANQAEAVDGDTEELPIYEANPDNNKAQATILVGAVPLDDYQMVTTLNNALVREDQQAVLSGTARYVWLDNEDEVEGAVVQVVVDGRTLYGTTDSRGRFSVHADFLAPGSYPLTAEVSDGTLVASATATLTVNPLLTPPAPRADLRVLDVAVAGGPGSYETESSMPHVLLNGAVNFSARIVNQGNLSVSAPFDVRFTVDGTEEVIGTVTVTDPLVVGASMTVYSPEPLWSSDTVGSYAIRATVDSGGVVAEWSESNNSRTKVIAVHEARPDLRPYFISGVVVPSLTVSPAEPVQGETLSIGVDVYNAGPVDLPETSFKVQFLINGEVIGEQEVVAAINSGGHVPVATTWDTSAVQAGYKNLAVIVDSEDVVLEDFENNNTAEASFELALAEPRLVITQTPTEAYWFSQTAYIEVGKTLHLDAVVKNIGGVAYEAGSFLKLSENQLSNELTDPFPQAVPSMGVDRSRSLRMTWTAPDEPTSLTLLLHVDGSVVSKPVVVYPVANRPEPTPQYADPAIRNSDIRILGSDWTRGDPVQAGATIRNLGDLDASNVLVQFFYSVDSVGYTPLGLSQTIAALPAGGAVEMVPTTTLDAVEPYYTIRVSITSLDAGNRSYNDAATRSFAIQAPWADAGDDQVSVIGRSVTLNGSASQYQTGYTWAFSSKPAGSTAELTGADTASPSFVPDVAGSYEIQLQVSDGALYSPYDWVNILVNEQVGTVLTVASAYGTPSPTAGTHPVTIGSGLSISAADVVSGGVKRVSTGWSGTGIDPATGTTTPAAITIIDELPSLTWQWETEYLFELTSVGDGSVTGDSGWLPEGGEATLEAVAGEGYEFFKWEGDLAGSSQNGSTINLPVDQARSIESHFRPVPVANFTAQVTSLETVQLSWTYNGLAEAAFRVERMLGGESHWETLATVSIPAFVDNTVAEGQSMFYRVFAVHGGLDSASVDTQIEVPYLPDVPANLSAEPVSITEVTVAWQPTARAVGYVLQRRQLPLGDWEALASLAAVTTWSDTAVGEGVRYAYRVRAYNASGNSGFSAASEVVVPVDSGAWTYGLQVDNVLVGGQVLSGVQVDGVLDVLLSNPAGDFTQHRLVAGLRDVDGVLVGTPVELFDLAGVPIYPPQWRTAVVLPEGLRLPAEPGTYTLWLEDFLTDGDPREAFAATVRTAESDMAKSLAVFEAVLPEEGDAFVAFGETSAVAGEFVDLSITVGAIGAENAFSFGIAYDPDQLEFHQLKPEGSMKGCYIQVNDLVPGEVGALMLLPLGQRLDAGIQELGVARFRIKETATSPVAVTFTDTPISRMVADPLAQLLPHVWYDGEVAVMAFGYEGDVSPRNNPNGLLNASDRAQIARYALGQDKLLPGAEFQRADCAPIATRGDGKVNLLDAIVVGNYIDGLEPLKESGGPMGPELSAATASMSRLLEGEAQAMDASGSGVIWLDAAAGQRGELLDVPVKVDASGKVAALSFSLSFDPNELSFLGATPASIVANGLSLLNAEQAAAGILAYGLQMPGGTTLATEEVVVLTLHFRVSKGASEVVTPIRFLQEPAELIFADGVGNEIASSGQDADVQLLVSISSGAPEFVSDLKLSLEAATRVRLDWTDVATEQAYNIYRRSRLEPWSLLVELPAGAETYIDESLMEGITYAYRIGAINENGESSSDYTQIDLPSSYRYWADPRFGSEQGAPDADEDGDGLWNFLEYLMGRNPMQFDSNAIKLGQEDIYGLGEDYLTLSFELQASASAESVMVETTDDLRSAVWDAAVEVERIENDGVRQLKFRSAKPMTDAPSQFMRVRSGE